MNRNYLIIFLINLNSELIVMKNYFIDYQQAYGIRYNPNNNKINDPVEPATIWTSSTTSSTTTAKNHHHHHVMKPLKYANFDTTFNHVRNRFDRLFTIGLGNYSSSETKILKDSLNPASKRFLSLFNVIKFDNTACSGGQNNLRQLQGTCYHRVECDGLGGVSVGNCASGYGVCCVFYLQCGQETNQNISYFESPNFPLPVKEKLGCVGTIKLLPDVKQVYIEYLLFELMSSDDFNDKVIVRPTIFSTLQMKPPTEGNCIEDQFIISGQNRNQQVPVICGINSGHHMYIDVDSAVDNKLYLSAFTSNADARIYSIRITQLRENLAPQNCLQYYTGLSGFIQTFNYDNISAIVQQRNASYFNNLNYAICIKRLPDYCTVTYSNEMNDLEYKFQLTNLDLDGMNVVPDDQAGAEVFSCADDYISLNGIRLCGDKLNDGSVSADYTRNSPVTDYSAGPIVLPMRTNEMTVGRGFKLFYMQHSCQNYMN